MSWTFDLGRLLVEEQTGKNGTEKQLELKSWVLLMIVLISGFAEVLGYRQFLTQREYFATLVENFDIEWCDSEFICLFHL